MSVNDTAVAAVLRLHTTQFSGGHLRCRECQMSWPCRTREELNAYQPAQQFRRCDSCEGRGFFESFNPEDRYENGRIETPCPDCDGEGRIPLSTDVLLRISRGPVEDRDPEDIPAVGDVIFRQDNGHYHAMGTVEMFSVR